MKKIIWMAIALVMLLPAAACSSPARDTTAAAAAKTKPQVDVYRSPT